MKGKENAVILSQERIAQGIYSMWLKTKAAADARPGQFISMYTNDGSKLLRARSVSVRLTGKRVLCGLSIVLRGEDTGTELFSKMKEGDTLPVIGPLGNGFPYEKAEGISHS